MNKLSMPVLGLSIALAVVLWYIATLLEGDRYAKALSPVANAPAEFGRQQADSPLRAGAAALRCEDSEQRIQALVDDSRYCEIDDDCTIFDFGYPIQCLTSVSKTAITELRMEFANYERDCPFRVYYDCPAEPLEREAVCRNQRCEVDLHTLDQLRDLTLQHLGIDPDS
ncbi:MAG: hypothetical protein HKN35_09355 [Woeseia sp.]|nr:hypothetical protein [Woeseia sp.]MBT8095945.1 hypothetical protein [Woeseia sp.]NNE61090.1 hypothetical protein [Woeseia sp.]NNL53771.1 hypothetical protein [Woeseia sp.]